MLHVEVHCFSCHKPMEPMKPTRWRQRTNWWCRECGHGVIVSVTAQPGPRPGLGLGRWLRARLADRAKLN